MPLYDRKCGTCEALFEVVCKISEKDDSHECPECASVDGYWMIGAPAVSNDSSRLMNGKKDGGFNQVIKQIANTHKGTPICERV